MSYRRPTPTIVPVLILLTAPAFAAPTIASASEAPTLADDIRALVEAEATAAGVPAAAVYAEPIELTTYHSDGSTSVETMRFDEAIEWLVGEAPAASGVGGTNELTVGDFMHFYANVAIGDARGYHITRSSLPDTPPVVLPPPATTVAYVIGGPTYNVKGSYLLGAHTVGSTIGSNVDTADDGPWIPVATSGAVFDNSIDFIGHAAIAQGQACIFGICFAIGVMMADGAAQWDPTLDTPFPTAP